MIGMINAGPYRGGLCEFGHASRSWARPAPRSGFFYWIGRVRDRPRSAARLPFVSLAGPLAAGRGPRLLALKLAGSSRFKNIKD